MKTLTIKILKNLLGPVIIKNLKISARGNPTSRTVPVQDKHNRPVILPVIKPKCRKLQIKTNLYALIRDCRTIALTKLSRPPDFPGLRGSRTSELFSCPESRPVGSLSFPYAAPRSKLDTDFLILMFLLDWNVKFKFQMSVHIPSGNIFRNLRVILTHSDFLF